MGHRMKGCSAVKRDPLSRMPQVGRVVLIIEAIRMVVQMETNAQVNFGPFRSPIPPASGAPDPERTDWTHPTGTGRAGARNRPPRRNVRILPSRGPASTEGDGTDRRRRGWDFLFSQGPSFPLR